jgi:hypothetical protein
MGWQAAVVGALGAAQIQQQGAYGKFNEAKNNRDAQVAEQKTQILDDKLTLDLSTFEKKLRELEGSVIVNTAKSGVTQGGSAANVRLSNLYEAELEKDKMRYDTEIGKARAFEDANFSSIKGQMARQEARIAQLRTATGTGTSLLQMKG